MANATKKLQDHHRAFLVREFACYAGPKEAAAALREEYGIEIAPQSAQHYDATAGAGSDAAKKWHDLFAVARKAFLDDVEKRVPEAYKAVRIHELAKASRAFKKKKNFIAMADMFERIAKEVGNVHTNRREFTGKDRGPIQFEDVSTMTPDQIDAELRELTGKSPANVHEAPETKQ